MKKLLLSGILLLLVGAFATTIVQSNGYSLWGTLDGGGISASSGGNYQLGGTIGQADAETLTGGNYQLSGGFWHGAMTIPTVVSLAGNHANSQAVSMTWVLAIAMVAVTMRLVWHRNS